jgi:glycosyltransferase involved in cell wall biosynthesis
LKAWEGIYSGEVRYKTWDNWREGDVDWADVIVLQREATERWLLFISRFRKQGKAVILDIDDLLTEVPPFLIAYRHYRRIKPFLVAAMQMVNLVTTTTPRLAAELERYQSRVRVIPNCPLPIGRHASHYRDDGRPIVIIVASSDTIQLDFVVSALRRVIVEPGLRVKLVAIGPPGEFLEQEGIPAECVDKLSYEAFLTLIASQDNAIGVIPLEATKFSSCKSAIKFLDYGLCGVPSICSNVPPYSDAVTNGVTGILVENDEESWFQAILDLAHNADRRGKIALAAQELCRNEYSLRTAADIWQSAILLAREHAHTDPVVEVPFLRRMLWRARSLGYLLVSAHTYSSLVRALLREGWSGVRRRLRRI